MAYKKKQQGFSLTEMLVVIAIIVIISGFLVVNFRKGAENSNLQRSAQQMVQAIRKAQNMALSSKKVGNPPEIFSYYGVHFNKQSMPNSCYVFAGNNKTYDSGEEIETITLEKGIIVDSLSTGSQLDATFSPPQAFVGFNPTTSSATVTIKKEGGTCPQDCRYIKINDTGWISIKKTP